MKIKLYYYEIVLIAASMLLLNACASSQLTIESTPSGAIIEVKNKPIGQTPLTLSEKDYTQYLDGNLMYFTVKKEGYLDKSLYLQPTSMLSYKFELTKLAEENFKSIPTQYSGLVHEITRELLTIQGLIFANKTDDAKTKLSDFEKTYPNVAAASTLKASIEILKGNIKEAYAFLTVAQKLDPKDLQVQKMMTQLSSQNREPSNAK
jgi:hypothetical protein